MKKIRIILLATITCCACSSKPETEKNTETLSNSTVVQTEKTNLPPTNEDPVTDGSTAATPHAEGLSLNGTIITPPQRMATVTLTLGGVITHTSLLPGQHVQKGAVLATLENPEFIELQQEWLESKAQIEYLEAEYHRQKKLSSEQAASQKKFQQSKAEYLSMKSRLEAATAQLSLFGVSTGELEKNGIQPLLQVKAPIAGHISHIDMNIGKYINPGDMLCEIIDKSQTMLKLTAYEKDLTEMRVNMPVEFKVNGMGSKTFAATIISIGQKVNEVSRSLEVYARIDDMHAEFRPGMYVTAQTKK